MGMIQHKFLFQPFLREAITSNSGMGWDVQSLMSEENVVEENRG